jgi:hypothetical protein
MTKCTLILLTVLAAYLALGESLQFRKVEHLWKNYSPQCVSDCKAVGDLCDVGKEIVCCMKGKCSKKYELEVCSAPLVSFVCNPVPQDDLIKQVIDPKLYPNLFNKP